MSTSQVNANEQTTSIKQIAIGASSTATTEAEPDVVMAESDIPVVRDSNVEATNRAVVDSITTTHSTTPVDGATAPGSSTERVNGRNNAYHVCDSVDNGTDFHSVNMMY